MSQGKKGYLSLRKKVQVTHVKSQTEYYPLDLSIAFTKSVYFIMDVVNQSTPYEKKRPKTYHQKVTTSNLQPSD